MGEHKGWRVREEPRSCRWRGEVRVNGSYVVKTWDTAKQAREWARDEAAQVAMSRAYQPINVALLTAAAAADYLRDLERRGRAPSYLRDVRLILGSAAKACPTLDGRDSQAQLTDWLSGVRNHGDGRGKAGELSPARRNKYRAVVRALCAWAIRHDKLRISPLRASLPAAVPDTMKPQLSLEELRKLVAYQPQPDGWRWAMLMLYAGLRADEARCLRFGDIDMDGGCILIRGESGGRIKRGRERIVPLQPELLPMLTPLGPPAMRIVQLGPGNLGRTFSDLLEDAGVSPGSRSPHSMRHTYAGLLTATGVPTAMVGAYLGHTQASTTLGYTKLATRYLAGVTGWERGTIRLTA